MNLLSMLAYIDTRVTEGHYGNASEYIRDLIRKDQEAQAIAHFRHLVEEGLASGAAEARSNQDREALMAIARDNTAAGAWAGRP
jgi:antitoxin ParD1/3/4